MPQRPDESPVAFRRNLKRWFRKSARDLPWRRHRNDYSVCVSEFMLQQTQVATVIPYFQRWIASFPDWQHLASADDSSILKHWEGLGYYSRARNLHLLAREVVAKHSGRLPSEVQALLKLPGIGPYTAGAIASLAYHRPVPVVDGNVERVFSRLFTIRKEISLPATKKLIWNLAEHLVPSRDPGAFNEALMELGATICTPAKPQCLRCPVRSFCTSPDPEMLPVKKKIRTIALNIDYALIRDHRKAGRFWLIHPNVPGRWKGFYRLPEFDSLTMSGDEVVKSLKFGITKYRISARVLSAQWKCRPPSNGTFLSVQQLETLALPAPVRRMIEI